MRKWLIKKFHFSSYGKNGIPYLKERLHGTPCRIKELVRQFPGDWLRMVVDEDWDVMERVGHMYKAEAVWLNRIQEYKGGKEKFSDSKLLMEKSPDLDMNDFQIDELVDAFIRRRQELIAAIFPIDFEIEHTVVIPEIDRETTFPGFLSYIADHDDYHLAHIREIWEAYERV